MLTFEIARQLVRADHTADTPPRVAPSVHTAARVLDLHGRAEEIADSGIAVGPSSCPEPTSP